MNSLLPFRLQDGVDVEVPVLFAEAYRGAQLAFVGQAQFFKHPTAPFVLDVASGLDSVDWIEGEGKAEDSPSSLSHNPLSPMFLGQSEAELHGAVMLGDPGAANGPDDPLRGLFEGDRKGVWYFLLVVDIGEVSDEGEAGLQILMWGPHGVAGYLGVGGIGEDAFDIAMGDGSQKEAIGG